MSIPVSITSEVGALKAVLLHRPGRELESLTPQYLDSMLFEDIPFLEMMKEEHDRFAQVLSDQGCSVFYVESLLEEVLSNPQLQQDAIEYLVASSHLFSPSLREIIKDFLEAKTPKELVSYCIGGVLKTDIDAYVTHKTLSYYIRDAYPYYISPLPNLYFTRDPATTVGGGISVNLMKTESRRRENWLVSQIFHHHPQFSQARIHQDYTMDSSIEGGDILILNESTIIIGASARTDVWAIESFAKRMMSDVESGGEGFREILVVQIPFTRAYMHLDTVFTMVDIDRFCIFPGIESTLRVFRLTLGKLGSIHIHQEKNLKAALKKSLNTSSVDLIKSGGDDVIASAREQWNDSTNTLAVAPGTIITYKRNVVSNETLSKQGITVIPIGGSELVRGRGGPRCMSMPLVRDPLS